MKRRMKHLVLVLPVMVIAMMIACGAPVFAGEFLNDTNSSLAGPGKAITIQNEVSYPIIDGVTEGEVTLKSSRGISTAHIILVKPNAKAKFKSIVPGYYQAGSTKETRKTIAKNWTDSSWRWKGVSDIVAEYNSAADTSSQPVLAAINGDFYGYDGHNAPRGTIVMEGNRMAHSLAQSDEFMVGLKKNGFVKIFQNFTDQEGITEEGICAPFWIVRNGSKNLSGIASNDGSEKRTGFATKPNGEAMMITVEAPGVSVSQLADLMICAGFNNGVNFDGGRSITFLSKRAGENLSRKSELYYTQNGEYIERPTASALMLVADNEGVANKVPTVGTGTTVETDKDEYEQGEPIYVTASSDVDGAWVSLLKKDDSDNASSIFWYYVDGEDGSGDNVRTWVNGDTYDMFSDGVNNGRIPLSTSLLLDPGDYRVVVLKGPSGNYTNYGEKAITITEMPVDSDREYKVETDKTAYKVGENIKFRANAPVVHTWVGLFRKDDLIGGGDISPFYAHVLYPDQNQWVTLNKPSKYVIEQQRNDIHDFGEDLPAGEYRAVLFSKYDNDYIIKDQKEFMIYDDDTDFNITYKNGEETITGLMPDKYRCSTTGPVVLPENAQVEGHTFHGWYDNPELEGPTVTTIPAGSVGNKTFYGKFEAVPCSITFDSNGGSAIDPNLVTVPYGSVVTRPDDPTRELYFFSGWFEDLEDSTPFDFEAPIKSDITLYAKWLQGNRVDFNTHGGSSIGSQGVRDGEYAVKPTIDPTKTGYSFAGWFKDSDCQQPFDFETEAINGDIEIHAGWTVNQYTITFDSDGGSAVKSIKQDYDTAITAPEDPTKEGFVFDKWDPALPDKMPANDLTVKAIWKPEPSLTTDKSEYIEGEAINVTANCDNAGSWVGIFAEGDIPASGVSYAWYNTADHNGEPFNILNGTVNRSVVAGKYRVILFGDDQFTNILDEKTIQVKEDPNPMSGKLELTGWSRDDKTRDGVKQYDYYYGDEISVKVVDAANTEGAWVGVYYRKVDEEPPIKKGDSVGELYKVNDENSEKKWINVDDMNGKSINMNYVHDGHVAKDAAPLPNDISYWMVLVNKHGVAVDSVPFIYRTFKMGWSGEGWEANVKDKIKVEQEWTSKVADGTNLVPSITIKRVNGHFGYDESGNEIKEVTLKQGKNPLQEDEDYFVTFMDKDGKTVTEIKEPGTYTVGITFQSDENQYNFSCSDPDKNGLKDTIKYTLTKTADDHVIDYVLNGGKNSDANPETYQTGTEVKLQAPTRTGYIFDGWFTTSDFQNGTEIESIPASATENYTLYAKWIDETSGEVTTYSITYVLNGGENDVANPDKYTGRTEITINPAKKSGATFGGWFFDEAFTQPADTIPKGTTGNLTLYAKFTQNGSEGGGTDKASYKITTDVTGGTISSNKTVKEGESYTVSYEPNEGYVLESVNVDGKEVDKTAFASSYTFENVTADHIITVTYVKAGSVVRDGYNAVVGGSRYRVMSAAGQTATLIKAKNLKKITVPSSITLADGKAYKVVQIDAKAFTSKKIKTVTIGKNVKKIAKNAFKGSKAKTVVLKTKKLKKSGVKGAFKGSKVKTVQVKVGKKKVNKKYVKKYKKIFTKKNAGKKVKVK